MLKKKIVCLILVLCAALVLTACGQQQETYPNQPRQDTGAAQQQAPVQEQVVAEAPAQQINFNDGSYDPASEEGGQSEQVVAATNAATAAPVMQSEYALTNVWPYWIGFAICMVGFYVYNRRHA